jgi:hypothetical protein
VNALDTTVRNATLGKLRAELFRHEIDRREFVRRAAALGLAAPAAAAMARVYGASAARQAVPALPSPARKTRPRPPAARFDSGARSIPTTSTR